MNSRFFFCRTSFSARLLIAMLLIFVMTYSVLLSGVEPPTLPQEIPVRFDTIIDAVADQYEINPLFVKALIWRESRFNPRAKGNAGEIGLMQIKYSVVIDWAKAMKIQTPTEEEVFDPYLNLQIGIWRLNGALENWSDRPEQQAALALCEYNAGYSRVLRWIAHYDGDYGKLIDNCASADYVRAISDKFVDLTISHSATQLASVTQD